MIYTATTATKKIIKLNKRYRFLAGSMRASKTISVLLYLITRAQQDLKCSICNLPSGCKELNKDTHKTTYVFMPTLTSIVSETFPHLRKGAIRDFINIMQGHNYFDEKRWNKSEATYTFETGSQIEFFSADSAGKIHGPTRDRLFVNEANNVGQEAWEQLMFRTREFGFADWNPLTNFHLYDDYGLQDEGEPTAADDRVDFLILTYKDNESLEPAIVEDIERKAKLNPAWGRVYAEGRRGEIADKIFKGWKIIPEVPHEARLERRGLDFGYAQDPMALCDIYYYNGGYIIDEIAYRKGMLNRQTADLILNQPDPNILTIADSAEPKSIAEMQEYGINIIGVQKVGRDGANFTNASIEWVQSQQMSITQRSLNYIKSYRSFMWQTDKDGNTIPKYDHFMSDGMMSVVYGMDSLRPRKEQNTNIRTGNLSSMWA